MVKPEGDFAFYLDHVEGRRSSCRDFTRHVKSDSVRGLCAACANEQATFHKNAARSLAFDTIVDDGLHRPNDAISSFLTGFPLIKPGGIDIAEDMHCACSEPYGGGVLNDLSCAAFFCRLVDTVNSDPFSEADNGSLFRAFPAANPILEVAAHDAMFLVRKASPARPRGLGAEIIVGDIAIADDRVLRTHEAMLKKGRLRPAAGCAASSSRPARRKADEREPP